MTWSVFSTTCFDGLGMLRRAAMCKSSTRARLFASLNMFRYESAALVQTTGRLAAMRGIPQGNLTSWIIRFAGVSGSLFFLDLSLKHRFDDLPVVEPSQKGLSSQFILTNFAQYRYLCASMHLIAALILQYTVHPLGQLPGYSHNCYSRSHPLGMVSTYPLVEHPELVILADRRPSTLNKH